MSDFTADEILKAVAPELIFTNDEAIAKVEYRRLAFKWHPDQNPSADPRVMVTINELYQAALAKIKAGTWEVPGEVTFKTLAGKMYAMRYVATSKHELGEIYVGQKVITYTVTKDNLDLYRAASDSLKKLKFANADMKKEMQRYLPKIKVEIETEDRLVLVLEKKPEQFLMSDVITAVKRVDPKHVAWMLSRLYNFACFLKYNETVHSGITASSLLVNPTDHSMIINGWWYSTQAGKRLTALPSSAISIIPDKVLKEKKSTSLIDLEQIKALGRQLLGDVNGSSLLMDKTIPRSLLMWLRTPAGDDAFSEFDVWQKKVLVESFGKRKFVEMKLTHQDVYGVPLGEDYA